MSYTDTCAILHKAILILLTNKLVTKDTKFKPTYACLLTAFTHSYGHEWPVQELTVSWVSRKNNHSPNALF